LPARSRIDGANYEPYLLAVNWPRFERRWRAPQRWDSGFDLGHSRLADSVRVTPAGRRSTGARHASEKRPTMPATGQISLLFALCCVAGCSSTLGGAPVDPAAYAAQSCPELNAQVTELSARISQTAIERGKVARSNLFAWVPAGERVASSAVDRRTARIEREQEQLRLLAAARDRACS